MKSYVLDDDNNVIPTLNDDTILWAKWFEDNPGRRKVGQDRFDINGEEILVSTVFLGLDHSFSMDKKHTPICFETMIFGGKHDQYQERYATWKEAEIGHKVALELAKS